MIKEYKYHIDRKVGYRTALHLAVFAILAAMLFCMYDGGYVLAWFMSTIIAVIGLMILSIPRRIVLNDTCMEIQCISDLTKIPYKDIVAIRCVDDRDMKFLVPLFASYGFFGYYGYFINLCKLDLIKIYASSWGNFIEITDIYEDRCYVSCDSRDEVVRIITERISNSIRDVQQ